MKRKGIAGLVLALVCMAAAYAIPMPADLSRTGLVTIGMLLAFLLLLIFEVFPMVVTCFLFLGLMPLLKVVPTFSAALSGFANQVVFFILASFGIAAAFTEIPLSKRILKALMKTFGKDVKSVLFAVMLCAALLSSVVSNVPTCAIFMAIGLNFLQVYDDPEERRRTGRAFMIGIPVASMIGGMMTPAGSSINLLAIGLLEEFTGTTISFVQWMCAGIPLTVFALPVAWLLVVKVYRPAELGKGMVRRFAEELDVPQRITPKEGKVLVIIPVAPSLVTIMVPPLVALAAGASVAPALVILACALCACNCYLLPLDTVTLLTYGTGYYSMTDMAKSTLPLQIWIVVIVSLWLPVVGKLFGIA